MASIINNPQEQIARQRDYVKQRQLENQREAAAGSTTSGLVDEQMLAQTMRSVRYEDEAHAAGDIIDNAIEAGASQVHIIERTEGNEIQEIAFLDDGSGIDPSFLPHATKWGGSSNLGQRNTFGRFGFGLPSASVNRGRSFSVYSRITANQPFSRVGLDLDSLPMVGNIVQLPVVTQTKLPDWVAKYADEKLTGGLDSLRTVVVWSKLDRLEWARRQQSENNMRQHLGITYAGWLDVCKLYVSGEAVEPVDVLFTTPGFRYYDIEDAPRADAQTPIKFEVPDEFGAKHEVSVRFSYLSKAAHDAEVRSGGQGRPAKIRQKIRKEYNGVFVTRNGRFIELVKKNVGARGDDERNSIMWSVYGRQVGIAIDFPPALDDLFGVTPDKQTIMFRDRLNDLLVQHGVVRAYKALLAQVAQERARLRETADVALVDGVTRPSEKAIAKVIERDIKRTRIASQEVQDEAERNFKQRVRELAKETGVPEAQVESAQAEVLKTKPYEVKFINNTEDDPFYTPTIVGTQVVLQINTGHPWYRELYSRLREDQAELRSGLELMLWVLATSEIDADTETRTFYRAERRQWSQKLADAFDVHPTIFGQSVSERQAFENDSSDEGDSMSAAG